MYILKNAWRSIVRSPGRTILIIVLVGVIATACCVSLSIQQSANVARLRSESLMNVKAHINVDRQYVMEQMEESDSGESKEDVVKSITGLTLDELKVYAEAEMVDDFYYYANISLDGANGFSALNQADKKQTVSLVVDDKAPGGGSRRFQMEVEFTDFNGDFILYGYLSDASMEDFQDGSCYITKGTMFSEDTYDYECIITEELSTFNNVGVGDQITLTNPKNSDNRFVFTIVGIYKNSTDDTTATTEAYEDPANHILTSYRVLENIVERSAAYYDPSSLSSTVTLASGKKAEQLLLTDGSVTVKGGTAEDMTAEAEDIELSESVIGTYVFQSIEDYDAFEAVVYEMGLDHKYVVVSNDVATFEASLVPLDNLSDYAKTFLYIILGVGALILVGVNFYNIRERKYEIGALTAMGMRKAKVGLQFVLELTIVTFLGIALGLGIGAVVSTPVTNTLLSNQIAYEQTSTDKTSESFGRDVSSASGMEKPHGGDVEGEVDYLDSVQFTLDYVIIYRMAVIGALLTLFSSCAAMISILRYNPLDILAERN